METEHGKDGLTVINLGHIRHEGPELGEVVRTESEPVGNDVIRQNAQGAVKGLLTRATDSVRECIQYKHYGIDVTEGVAALEAAVAELKSA